MKDEDWDRLKLLFEQALEAPPEEREGFLRSRTADPAILSEVRSLLAVHEASPEFLEGATPEIDLAHLPPFEGRRGGTAGPACMAESPFPPVWLQDQPEPGGDPGDPQRIGVYRIVRRLGQGGMAVVYLAERDDAEYTQQVALKALGPGPRSARLLRLFHRERQILAQLQHPNIAWLMDGGTADGFVYFAMEYVDGKPVTEYCNQRQLTVHQRLELFCRISEAVSYAHRKLVIHRDLKPANILVTADGVPKLLDFGLARVFQDSGTAIDGTASTTGVMLTPAYASPEQVRGQPLSTATDVYSLGVLLYELLTGRNPQVRGEHSPLEVCRTILDEEPISPSRAADPGRRQPLKGDLDDILLLALRKEPERRYGSVDQFREDIERYLGGFPVRASRGSVSYHFRKYLGRHRWGIAVSLLGVSIALAGATTTWWEGRQAEMRFEQVRSLAHSVIFEFHDAISNLKGSTAARKLIVERALEYLRNLEAGGAKKRDLQLEIADAYRKIGEAQGAWTTARSGGHLGDMAGAARSYEQARNVLRGLRGANGQDHEVLQALSEVNEDLARVLLVLGDTHRWRALWDEATGMRRKLARAIRPPPMPALTCSGTRPKVFISLTTGMPPCPRSVKPCPPTRGWPIGNREIATTRSESHSAIASSATTSGSARTGKPRSSKPRKRCVLTATALRPRRPTGTLK